MEGCIFNDDKVSIYNKNICIHANGQSANIIAFGIIIMLILIGIATLIRVI